MSRKPLTPGPEYFAIMRRNDEQRREAASPEAVADRRIAALGEAIALVQSRQPAEADEPQRGAFLAGLQSVLETLVSGLSHARGAGGRPFTGDANFTDRLDAVIVLLCTAREPDQAFAGTMIPLLENALSAHRELTL